MLKDAVDLNSIRRALVIKLRHHGDVLLSSPVFSVLHNHAPHLQIDALIYGETAQMLSLHPSIHSIHCIDRQWKKLPLIDRLKQEHRLLSNLRARQYDLVIHLTDHSRGAWLVRLLGPRFSVAPNANDKHALWRKSFTHLYALPRATPRHTVELNLDALRRIGVYPDLIERKLTLVLGEEAYGEISALLNRYGLSEKKYIHIHPASRWHFKCWDAEKVAMLINSLCEQGYQIVMTAAPSETELALIEAINKHITKPIIDLSGKLTLKQLAALTARAQLFIGVDSAPMHIAAAVQTPTVALFGPSGEKEWGPWQVPHRVVHSDHVCRPCGNDGCGGGKLSECLSILPVTSVLNAVNELLEI